MAAPDSVSLHALRDTACHSVFSCPLPYHKCQRCVDETRIYYFPTGDLAAETPEEKNAEQVRWLLHLAGHKFGSPENLAELDAAAKEAKRKVWRTVFDV
ncbi:MAG TPA: hypothetical protein VKB96_14235 [Gammaproteobacteria bacterium]|nr:hypothetical protein [Gammaproteobacteria bacterium]